jgi:Acyltransferase family
MQHSRVQFADSLRGVACLSVVLAHYGGFWKPSGVVIPLVANVPPLPADVAPPYLYFAVTSSHSFSPAGFGVALFFLISGFVIPLSLNRLGTFSFLRARCWRIGPTYAVGFLFTVAALALASRVYGKPFPYSPTELLLHIVPGPRLLFGSRWVDYAIWTLEIEVCFYLLCAIIAPWLRAGSMLVFAIPLALSAASLFLLTGIYATYAQALAFMLIGTAFNFHLRKHLDTPALFGVVAVLCIVSVGAMAWTQGQIIMGSYATAEMGRKDDRVAELENSNFVDLGKRPQEMHVRLPDVFRMSTQFRFDRTGPDDDQGIIRSAQRFEQYMQSLVVAKHADKQKELLTQLVAPFLQTGWVAARIGGTIKADRDHLGLVPVRPERFTGFDVVGRGRNDAIHALQKAIHQRLVEPGQKPLSDDVGVVRQNGWFGNGRRQVNQVAERPGVVEMQDIGFARQRGKLFEGSEGNGRRGDLEISPNPVGYMVVERARLVSNGRA